MAPPLPAGSAPHVVHDPTCERLRELQVWQIAYCRDVVKPLGPGLKGARVPDGHTMVGRAYTVEGPEIYIDALEGIGPGEVYIQAGCHATDAVFSPGWTHAYLKPRGAVGCVVDGGVYKSFECQTAAVPMFCGFHSPSVAINRAHAGTIGKTVTIGGVAISPGDIICADADGVVVINKEDERDLMAGLEAYLEGNGNFGKLAGKYCVAKGVPMSEHPAVADMFARKYANPSGYWRDYADWWATWKHQYPVDGAGGNAAFYSGKPRSKL
jgi:regulator of RNase E activity RraA